VNAKIAPDYHLHNHFEPGAHHNPDIPDTGMTGAQQTIFLPEVRSLK
jgi:hypothetical protein